MSDLILIAEIAVCAGLIAAFNYGRRHKSDTIMIFAGLFLIPAGLVLISEITIDRFYREMRSRSFSDEEMKVMLSGSLPSKGREAVDALQPENPPQK